MASISKYDLWSLITLEINGNKIFEGKIEFLRLGCCISYESKWNS